jgi:hypothetical protein
MLSFKWKCKPLLKKKWNYYIASVSGKLHSVIIFMKWQISAYLAINGSGNPINLEI